jgi:hypothetical protein
MSLPLSIYGTTSSFSEDAPLFTHLSFNGGYAEIAPKTLSGDFYVGIRVRFDDDANSAYVLGSSLTSHRLLDRSASRWRTTLNSTTVQAGFLPLDADTWYYLEFYRTGTTIVFRTFLDNPLGTELGENILFSQTTNDGRFQYVARWLSNFTNLDVSYLEIGTLANKSQHKYEVQSSGTTWFDTGTVGGWDLTITGAASWQ